jgi:hypothetical protein
MNIKLCLGSLALFALHAVIIATPALAAPAVNLAPVDVSKASTLPERASHNAPRVRQVMPAAPRCSVRYLASGPVRVCR